VPLRNLTGLFDGQTAYVVAWALSVPDALIDLWNVLPKTKPELAEIIHPPR
jgi:hypothetical protein